MSPNIAAGMTEAQIRLQLVKEEKEERTAGSESLHPLTPSGMLATLLDLEDQQ